MTPFELAEPKSLSDAVKLLDPDDPTVRPIAGGTALMLMMKAGVFRPAKLDQPARHRGEVFRHCGERRRIARRRHDHAERAGALRRSEESSRR